jgi:glycine/D-amino acid oxidase-like deaminating enzyme
MKLRSKETYWLLKNGLIKAYPSLKSNASCDILIIGGGITGALMAFQFSKEGFDTILVDKRDISFGSTSATTAMVQYEIDEPLYSLIEKVGEEKAVDSYAEGVKAIAQLQRIVNEVGAAGDFTPKKSLYRSHSKRDLEWLRQEYECRVKFGFDVDWLSKEQLNARFLAAGYGGILSASGADMDAYSVAHRLLSYSADNFLLRIYDHTSIEKVEYENNLNRAFTDDAYEITCKKIIYATGYESHELFKNKIVDLISTYACVSEPLTDIPQAMKSTIFWDTQDPYVYIRVTADNRILIGGGDESFKDPQRRDNLIDKKELYLFDQAYKFFPGLSLTPDFSWAGTFGVTKDALPFIGEHPDFPNSFFMLGFGGNGITFSIMGMDILSDAVAGRYNKFLEYYKFNR